MTPGRTRLSLLAVLAASTFAFTACGSDDEDTTASTTASTGTTAATAASSAVSLKDVCPAKVVIQTDWHPESDHSEAYALVDPATAEYDKGKKRVTGKLMAQGQDTGVEVEVRAGGPATGFQSPTQQMYTDKSITLGYLNTDESVQNAAKFPMVAVMAPREKWAQVLIYDPGSYDFKTIADIGKTDTKVLYFKGNVYMDYLTGAGILKKDQVDSSYDGKPARFVTGGGKVVQQGFVTAEPWQYENAVKQWGKKVATLPIADAGNPNYGEAIGVRKADVTSQADCLKKLVPIMQQAQVDYVKDPTATNAVIVEAAKVYDNGWDYPKELADYATKAQVDGGIIANGANATLGDLESSRIQKMIDLVGPIYAKQNIDVPSGLKAADLFTNEFIDTKIGLPASESR
jgi:hypothetical protein